MHKQLLWGMGAGLDVVWVTNAPTDNLFVPALGQRAAEYTTAPTQAGL